jgi:hypothetical protein
MAIATKTTADDFFNLISVRSEVPNLSGNIVYRARHRDHLVSNDDSKQASVGDIVHKKTPGYEIPIPLVPHRCPPSIPAIRWADTVLIVVPDSFSQAAKSE